MAGEDSFSNDLVMIDVVGLGSFNIGASGDFSSTVARRRVPEGTPRSAISPSYNALQFSGRLEWGGGLGVTGMLSRYIGLTLHQAVVGGGMGSEEAVKADFFYVRHQTSGAIVLRRPLHSLRLARRMELLEGA